MAKRLKIPKE